MKEQPPFFDRLPDEILLRILRLVSLEDILKSISGTCRRFRRVRFDAVTGLEYTRLPKKKLHWLIENCNKLRKIFLDGSKFNSVQLAIHALKCCPLLEELKWINCGEERSPELFRALKDHGRSLRKLSLSFAIMEPAAPMPRLLHLDLWYSKMDKRVMATIGDNYPALESLRLYWYHKSGREPPGDVTPIDVLLDKISGTIKEIDLQGTVLNERCYQALERCQKIERVSLIMTVGLGLSGLRSVLELRHLKDLFIHNLPLSDGEFVRAFSGKKILERLETLILDLCDDIGDAGISAIKRACPGLVKLSLGCQQEMRISDARTIVGLFEECKDLRSVQLARCYITPEAVGIVGGCLPLLKLARDTNGCSYFMTVP